MTDEGETVRRHKEVVREHYATVALTKTDQQRNPPCCAVERAATCCQPPTIQVPSLGCIVSLAQRAGLKPGEVVVDLGSGLGHDVFEAADLVGPEGRVIGIDFTQEMVDAARKTAEERGYTGVEFRLADMEDVPLPDGFADVVISNCVINLSPNKLAVFREAYRILKPGGRLVDADEIAAEELPKSLVEDKKAWCGCVGGALTAEGYSDLIRKAGFEDITVTLYSTHRFRWEGGQVTIHSGIIRGYKR
ncbi:MAG: methyltransferase domain-containing protein [Candidatus Bathyarchaeia archaeon]